MKSKIGMAPSVALIFMFFSSNASAVVVNFNALADGSYGESAYEMLTIGIMHVTGHATDDAPIGVDNQQYAYLDANNAGLGVCKDLKALAPLGPRPNLGSNICSDAGDDNVTENEYLEFMFDEAVRVENIYFNNNHDGGIDPNVDTVLINGESKPLIQGYVGAPDGDGIGPFFIGLNDVLTIKWENQQFYISGIEYSVVPVPAAVWLFGTALAGLIGFGRRKKAAA